MPRLARLSALLAAAVVLVTSGGPVASLAGATDGPTFPPYVLFKGMGFDITSNEAWQGVDGTSGVREVEPYESPSHRGADASYAIWTPTCTPGQKFSVARTVDLLGPPQSVTFDFQRSMWVASTAVLVNNRLASKSLGNNTPPDLSPAASGAGTGPLAFFHPGINKLEVVVTVADMATACNAGTTRPFVWFRLYGAFASELTVGAPNPGQSPVYFQADSGRSVITRIHLTNNGPDLVPEATFTVSIGGRGFCTKEYGDGLCESAMDYQFSLVHSPGGIECPWGAEPNFVTLTCPITDWEPGQSLLAAVAVVYQPDPTYPSWAQESTSVFWGAHIAQGGPLQITGDKYQAEVGYIFCSKRSTLPGCLKATPNGNTVVNEGTCPTGSVCGSSSTTSTTAPNSPPPGSAGTFGLVSRLTTTQNTHRGELTINAAAGWAVLKHTGKYGGSGNGGSWMASYSWSPPRELVPGKPEPITLTARVSKVSPIQPLSFSIVALAPNFAQQLSLQYPSKKSVSKTYRFTLALDEKGQKDIMVTIEFESSSVTYNYRPA